MKILWVNPHFLHPTTKGGQIRTLEMLRHLHRWHEIHYVALENPAEPEGVAKSQEYSSQAYPIPHSLPPRGSASFVIQAAGNLLDPLPLAVTRYRSAEMKAVVAHLLSTGTFDRLVCDFLFAAPNIPSLSQAVLFQHNVETTIWDRHLENAHSAAARAFFRIQRKRMARYEGDACRQCAHVVAVSTQDAERFRALFHAKRVSQVPTGVDVPSFTPPNRPSEHKADLVFVGSMDWLPNIDGCNYFVREILPIIRRTRPSCTFGIVGRSPGSGILEMARNDPKILVSGTVPDIRPYFWGSSVSIVPLRIGGGTRLKIFEAMAAQSPIVSTTIGAEGLPVIHGRNLYLADTPEAFAEHCLALLDSESARKQMAQNAYKMVSSQFSWEHAARVFESILEKQAPSLRRPRSLTGSFTGSLN
jgi:glycosyltransferase involved in cell wall biosynthesis